ncbi:hypothetical protein [Streptomyces sp. B1I3]|uniref:hypothetical protein n=1 Tax=Streptomyces sp. B1I3 TaxID=3042264 RepID=UPI002789D8F5|nr:hypothetical protein [Streptomyces sp. B1I3]MDQ0797708.1 hypothetical protein [Streptomyces sp. B1I3]
MTTAHHLRLIDGMRARDFPSQRVASGSGVSGPGFHTAYLHGEEEQWGEDRGDVGQRDGDEAEQFERRAQCLAAHDALLTLLTLRWGAPQVVSLWSAQERMTAGEVMAEPWAELVASCEYLPLWRVEDRWIAVVLHMEDEGPGCELSVLVTVLDPP